MYLRPPIFSTHIVFIVFIFLASSYNPVYSNEDKDSEVPWNFLVILLDDAGWQDLGFSGNTFIETPNMDEIALRGFRFSTAYATHCFCSPTRQSIVTGQWPARTAWVKKSEIEDPDIPRMAPSYSPVGSWTWTGVKPEFTGLAQLMNTKGYVTGHIGKWHFSLEKHNITPESVGFDFSFGGSPMVGAVRNFFSPFEGLPGDVQSEPEEYLTDRLTDEVISFIRQNKDKPFYVELSHYAPHEPIMAPESLVRKYRKKSLAMRNPSLNPTYAAMIDRIDQGVGRLISTLEELGLDERTVILLTSDNGGKKAFGSIPVSGVLPLRGQKGQLYEGGIRVPMAVYWPGHTLSGDKADEMVSILDFYPTVLDIAGIPLPDYPSIDGRSLTPLITTGIQEELAERPHFWYNPTCNIEESEGAVITPVAAVRLGDWKLIEQFGRPLELYNLLVDPSESVNQFARMPKVTNELKAILDAWLIETNMALPTSNPAFDPDFMLPCQVSEKLFDSRHMVRSWDFHVPDQTSWREARLCNLIFQEGFIRVVSKGIYPEIYSTDLNELSAGDYLIKISLRVSTGGRIRFHWHETNSDNGTIELFPDRDGKWHELAGIFRVNTSLESFRLAGPTHLGELGFYDSSVDPDYIDINSIQLMKLPTE